MKKRSINRGHADDGKENSPTSSRSRFVMRDPFFSNHARASLTAASQPGISFARIESAMGAPGHREYPLNTAARAKHRLHRADRFDD